MRRIVLALVSTVAAVALLFSYRTSRGPEDRAPAGGAVGAAPVGVVPPSAAAPASAGPSPTATGPVVNRAGNGTVVVNGIVAETFRGPVQVQVVITAGRIADVVVLVRPTGAATHDEINLPALPVLRAQALRAQSARLDGVSGATATSGGYRVSLQSALDAVHFR